MPLAAVAVAVLPPEANVPPPSASVTVELSVSIVLPYSSWTATVTSGAKAVPAVALPGWFVKLSFVAALQMVKGLDVAPARVPSLAVRI